MDFPVPGGPIMSEFGTVKPFHLDLPNGLLGPEVISMKSAAPVVISYLRFSRPEQLKGDSIRRQLTLGEQWAEKHGLKIADSFRDLGISAFRGKNAAEGNLSRLLGFIDSGRIPPGSVLLIEQLDRLSRNALLDALELFLSIVRRGVKIVTLMDGMEYDKESLNRGMQPLMYSLMQMSLAHEESAKKSERLAHAWAGKRQKIGQKVLTRKLPAWLKADGDKVVIDEAKAAIVRRMLRLALDGHGLNAITKRINAEADGLARVKYINRSYTFKILNSRALIGEFQPHRLTYADGKRKRLPIGEPVKGYYPPLITEAEFYAIQRQLHSRRLSGGRQGHYINLFTGLLYDRKDGSALTINNKGGGKRYVSSAALLGRKDASPYVAYPVDVMERGILLQLHDLILPHLSKDETSDAKVEAQAMEARIAEVERKISKTQEAMLSDAAANVPAVVALLSKLDQQRRKMEKQLNALRGEIAAHASTDLDSARDRLAEVVRYYRTGECRLSEDQRTELRNIIRQTIDRIEGTVTRHKRNVVADLTINLRDGSSLSLTLSAVHVVRMKRDAKGHPIKGGAKGVPQWNVGVFNQRWVVVPNVGKTVARVASPIGLGRIDVPIVK